MHSIRFQPASARLQARTRQGRRHCSKDTAARPRNRRLKTEPVKKRSVSIHGHRTSYSVEDPFQSELALIARREGIPIARVIAAIDADRPPDHNLSSAIRLFVLEDLRKRASMN